MNDDQRRASALAFVLFLGGLVVLAAVNVVLGAALVIVGLLVQFVARADAPGQRPG